jgi:Flp pilus assembly protein protease CpaA
VLTVVMVIRHKITRPEGPFENPYGIAIAIGALVALSERYLNHLA